MALATGHGPDHQKRLGTDRDRLGQGRIWRVMGQIPSAGEEPQEGPSLLGGLVANRSAQHRVARFDRVQDRALRGLALDVERELTGDPRQRPEMRRENDANHGRVWTSTDSTAGRSRTIGRQESPASADTYTWPPVVPKYTPHASSASTAIASRSTLT